MSGLFCPLLFVGFIISTVIADPLQSLGSVKNKNELKNVKEESVDMMETRELTSTTHCPKLRNVLVKPKDYATFWSKNFPMPAGSKDFDCNWNFRSWDKTSLVMHCPYIHIASSDNMTIINEDGSTVIMKTGVTRNYTYNFPTRRGSISFKKGDGESTSRGFMCTLSVINNRTPPAEICNCGEALSPARLLNSINAADQEFKWMVQFHTSSSSSQPSCVGALLNDRRVLTAESCISALGSSPVILLGNYKSSAATPSEGTITTSMKSRVTHPDYDASNFNHNLAIVELNEPVNFRTERTIRPICIPKSDTETFANQASVAASWGKTDTAGTIPSVLQKIHSEIYSASDKCGITNLAVTENSICAGKNAPSQICMGDLGAPLMVLNNGVYDLAGTAAFATCELGIPQSNVPFLFLRTTYYMEWINNNIGGVNCPRPA